MEERGGEGRGGERRGEGRKNRFKIAHTIANLSTNPPPITELLSNIWMAMLNAAWPLQWS